jgi:hypothetical protein
MATLTHFPLGSNESAWVMEYHPDFLHRWNPRPGGPSGVRRRDILARYRDVLGEDPRDPILEDVIGMTIAVPAPARDHLIAFCTGIGYRVVRSDGGAVALNGPDIALRLIAPDRNSTGIKEVHMRTREGPPRASDRRLGRATLRFDAGGATFAFE